MSKPHTAPGSKQDFQLFYDRGGEQYTWSRIWNYAPEQDYTFFVQPPTGSHMAGDPLG